MKRIERWRFDACLRLLWIIGLSVSLASSAALYAPLISHASPSTCLWHTVAPGDTLGNLGWAYHSSALAIARINHIADPDLIYVGQTLCIPQQGTNSSQDAASGSRCIWYMVVPGDTLGDLGWAYHSNALTLARINHIPNPDLIDVGQRLCLPVSPTDPPLTTQQRSSTTTASTAPATSKDPPASRGGSASGVQAFIQFVLPYARAAHRATGWPTSLILAQWGLEQGWHVPGYTGYNFGNCGAIPGAVLVPGTSVPGSPATFSYASTPEEGLRIYVYVAHLSYYAAVAPAATRGGPDAAALALGQSPWDAAHYTATGHPGSSLLTLLHTYNLYRYDSV